MTTKQLNKTFPTQPDITDLILALTDLTNKVQYRKRDRLLDADDLGEFAREIDYIRSIGGESLTCLIACPAKVASSYKGRCESTVGHWRREKDGSECVTIWRKEQMSKWRFKAELPNNSPIPYGYHWTNTKGTNIAAR